MKKNIILSTSLALLLGVGVAVGAHQSEKAMEAKALSGGDTVYLDPGVWAADNAWFAAYTYGKAEKWVKLESDSESGYYAATLPDNGNNKIIFTRMDPEKTTLDWSSKWNQTRDLNYEADKDLFKITGWGDNDGEWSTYIPPEYHVVGSFNSWKDDDDKYLMTVDSADSNHYSLTDVEASAGDEFKIHDFANDEWYDNGAGNIVISDAGTYTIDFYKKVTYGDQIVVTKQVVESHYKYAINGVVATDEMTKGTGTEYVSKSLSFKKGDVVTFFEGDAPYAVTPKEDSRLTKVYSTENGLKFAEDYDGVLYLETNGAKLWVGQFTSGYYLVGVGGEWNAKLGIRATKEAEGDAYAVSNITLAAGTEFKFVQAPEAANEFVWHPAVVGKTSTQSEVAYEVVQSEDESNGNFKVTYAGTYNIYFNPTDEGKYSIEEPSYSPVEGYFIMGSVSGVDHWKYNNPVAKMDNTTQGGNVAQLMNQSFAVGDQIRIRSYYNSQDPKVRWAELGTGTVDYGKKTGDNFEFTKAGAYDIYAKYEESVLYFYVSEHAISYTIQMNAVHFTGNGESSTSPLASQVAYKDQVFNPEVYSEENYITVGVFTDEACTTAYEPKAFTADGTLYVKYVRHAHYLTGDDTFLGEGHGWKVEYSKPIGPDGDNKLVGTVTVPEGASTTSPMKVKPLEYVADAGEGKPGWGAASYTMGHDEEHLPDFVHIDEEKNFVFTQSGTYAFYINQEDKVWFNGGEYAFYAKFLNEVGSTCDAQGKDTPKAELSTLWKETLANDYLKLSEKERNNLKDNFTIDSGDEKSSDDRLRFIAMYHYVVTKYGTQLFPDFVWGQSYEPASSIINPINPVEESTNSTIIIVVAASITALSFGLLIAIKKKRR